MNTYKIENEEGEITTPFNIEEILKACPKLYAKWKEQTFFIDVNDDGRVCIVYVEVPNA